MGLELLAKCYFLQSWQWGGSQVLQTSDADECMLTVSE